MALLFKAFRRPGAFPALAAGVLVACVVGCGKGDGGQGKLVPVRGKVVLGDKPLTTGVVIFRPDALKGNTSKQEPRGQIDADGNYKLMTAEQEGAAPGWYKVGVIAARQPADPKNPYALPRSLVPLTYNDPEKSGLALEVAEKPGPGAYDLKLSK
jgi:hypothetical protein